MLWSLIFFFLFLIFGSLFIGRISDVLAVVLVVLWFAAV
jgi:hypothetical protein